MRFSATSLALTALSAAAAVQAAEFADAFTGPDTANNFKLQAIYDSATMATNFTLTVATTGTAYGWHGIGTGTQMQGSNMVINWVNNNQVITSNRHAIGEQMPLTTGLTIAAIQRNDGLTKTDTSGTTVNWIQPGFPASGSDMAAVNMIWSYNNQAPTSSDPATTLYQHQVRGFITLDLTKPYNAASAGGSVASSSTGGSGGIRTMNKYNMIVIAHMVFMIAGWLLLFPAGVFIARFGRTAFKWFPKHRIVQLVGLLVVIIGMFLGFGIVWTLGTEHLIYRHEQLGLALVLLAVFQASIGAIGHALWHGKQIRLLNFLHIITGVTIIPLSAWNMGLGFDLWLWAPPKAASYVLYAWMGFLGLVYIIGLAVGLPKELKANKHDQAVRAGVDRADSVDSAEKLRA